MQGIDPDGLAVAGVAATPAAFAALRWLGAGYLAWLGARLLFAKRESQAPAPRQVWCHHRPLSFALAKLWGP